MNLTRSLGSHDAPTSIVTRCVHVTVVYLALLLAACGSGTVGSTAATAPPSGGDNIGPAITISAPTSATNYTSISAALGSLAGTASDAVGVTQVSWVNSLGGSGMASGTTNWSISNIPLVSSATPNLITVTARDAAGNIGTDTVSVSYSAAGGSDTTAPVITITVPSTNPSYTSSSATLTLAGTASDAVGVTQVSWANSLGGSGTAIGTTSWSVGSIALVSGATPNLITVTARDAAGNTGTDTISVSYGAGGGSSNTFYISPTGLDSNNGTTVLTPWKTFAYAFSRMVGGDELILLDGTYSVAAGIDTGIINYLGAGSGQPPSGTGVNNVTRVRALNAGNVTIAGGLFIGRSTRKDSYITIQGITFDGNSGGSENGGALYNTSYVTVKDCGFRGGLGVGTNDNNNSIVNSYALIEDVWIWGINTRISLIIYRSDHVVVRRAVVRNDGCLSTALPCGNNSGNAMVGTTIYNSHDVSFQNVIAVDNIPGPGGQPGASDFSIAWHNNSFYPFHRNEWLGTMSINTGLEKGYYYDIDNLPAAFQPMATYRDIVAINTLPGVSASGLSLNMNCGTGCAAHNISVRNATLKTVSFSSDPSIGIYVNPSLGGGVIDLQNLIVFGGGLTGVSSPDRPSYMDVNGFSSAYSQLPCTTTATSVCYTSNPTADGATPSLRYPTRIESGSLLKGGGAGGADIGATVLNRYGTDGTRHGDTGYNTLTSTPLWPWPNEARIKQQMCASETRGFCSAGTRLDGASSVTLTSYIWEQLGNQIPIGIYP